MAFATSARQAIIPFCDGIHENTETRVVSVPAHDSLSIGTLHGIAVDAGAEDFDAFCEWIDQHR